MSEPSSGKQDEQEVSLSVEIQPHLGHLVQDYCTQELCVTHVNSRFSSTEEGCNLVTFTSRLKIGVRSSIAPPTIFLSGPGSQTADIRERGQKQPSWTLFSISSTQFETMKSSKNEPYTMLNANKSTVKAFSKDIHKVPSSSDTVNSANVKEEKKKAKVE